MCHLLITWPRWLIHHILRQIALASLGSPLRLARDAGVVYQWTGRSARGVSLCGRDGAGRATTPTPRQVRRLAHRVGWPRWLAELPTELVLEKRTIECREHEKEVERNVEARPIESLVHQRTTDVERVHEIQQEDQREKAEEEIEAPPHDD